MKKKSFVLTSMVLIVFMVTLMLSSLSVFAATLFTEDFSDPTVLSATTATPWTDSGNHSTITNGQLSTVADWSGAGCSLNNVQPSGSYEYSFDISYCFTEWYELNNQVTMKFNTMFENPWSNYALVFKNFSGGLGQKVYLENFKNWETTTYGPIAYADLPAGLNEWRTYHIVIKYIDKLDGNARIIIDSTYNNNKTTLFDVTATTHGIGNFVFEGNRTSFKVDNIVLTDNPTVGDGGNDTYAFINASYIEDANKQINVNANIKVSAGFESATFLAATYDVNGNLISVNSQPYTAAQVVDGAIQCQTTLDPQAVDVAKVKVFMWDTLDTMKPFCESIDCLENVS